MRILRESWCKENILQAMMTALHRSSILKGSVCVRHGEESNSKNVQTPWTTAASAAAANDVEDDSDVPHPEPQSRTTGSSQERSTFKLAKTF